MNCRTVLPILLLLLTQLQHGVLAEPDHVMFYLKHGATQCFTLTAHALKELRGEVRVANANGDMKVGFWVIIAANSHILHSKTDVSYEKFTVTAPSGPHHGHDSVSSPAEYKLCVYQREGSVDSARDPRKVYVSFDAGPASSSFSDHGTAQSLLKNIARSKSLDSIGIELTHITEIVEEACGEIDAIRGREDEMFEETNRAARQIWILGIVGCASILVSAFFQSSRTIAALQQKTSGSRTLSRNSSSSRRSSAQYGFQEPQDREPMGRTRSLSRNSQVLPRHEDFSRSKSLYSNPTRFAPG